MPIGKCDQCMLIYKRLTHSAYLLPASIGHQLQCSFAPEVCRVVCLEMSISACRDKVSSCSTDCFEMTCTLGSGKISGVVAACMTMSWATFNLPDW